MALFLKNHSTAKYMILGRWSSDAFLAYIRPQVFEWTINMTKDMIHFKDFLDIGFYDKASPSDPRLRKKTLTQKWQFFQLHIVPVQYQLRRENGLSDFGLGFGIRGAPDQKSGD